MAAIAYYLADLTAKYSPLPFLNRRDECTGTTEPLVSLQESQEIVGPSYVAHASDSF